MTFDVEIMLRENHTVFTDRIEHDGNDPAKWTDGDVAAVMKAILGAIDQTRNPQEESQRVVSLRGVSWIVHSSIDGSVIAVDIPSGQAVAGPFAIESSALDGMLARVMSEGAALSTRVH
jgi:hypothetical protein